MPYMENTYLKQVRYTLKQKPKSEREGMILSCLPLVVRLSMENEKWPEYSQDLIQAGNEALCKCVDTYDPLKGKFSTYAYKYIKGYQQHFIRNERLVTGGIKRENITPIMKM